MTFSFIHYRNMNCVDANTELLPRCRALMTSYMVLRKSGAIPRYYEEITERGYDNIELTERLRLSCAIGAML